MLLSVINLTDTKSLEEVQVLLEESNNRNLPALTSKVTAWNRGVSPASIPCLPCYIKTCLSCIASNSLYIFRFPRAVL